MGLLTATASSNRLDRSARIDHALFTPDTKVWSIPSSN